MMPIKGMPSKGVVRREMHEFKHGELHSGSKHGPKVKSRKQAVAIALNEARQAGQGIKPPGEYGPDPVGRHPAAPDVAVPHPAHGMRTDDHFNRHAPSAFGFDFEQMMRHRDVAHVPEPFPKAPPKHGPYPAPARAEHSHGFGHQETHRHGHLRMSGDSRAHQIGKR